MIQSGVFFNFLKKANGMQKNNIKLHMSKGGGHDRSYETAGLQSKLDLMPE